MDKNTAMVRAVVDAAKSKPPEFLRSEVRYLALVSNDICSLDEAHELLGLCKNLVGFSALYKFTALALLPILTGIRVAQLGICLGELFRGSKFDLAYPSFETITHLNIFDGVDTKGIERLCPQLAMLPALTHLALDRRWPRDVLMEVLDMCPRLMLLSIFERDEKAEYRSARVPFVYDARFVIVLYPNFYDCWNDWENGTNGLSDVGPGRSVL
ncbi:hypothetical protein MVEN_01953500 [Mycena venus]|uniref:F-box domain-containing protein n=1 Tax=Mycena venus TaxID=2733690 RepID=A0A8H6XFS3_9AGAR|nr:hypothetical protein MVEN_01953500 [Mycena venus]